MLGHAFRRPQWVESGHRLHWLQCLQPPFCLFERGDEGVQVNCASVLLALVCEVVIVFRKKEKRDLELAYGLVAHDEADFALNLTFRNKPIPFGAEPTRSFICRSMPEVAIKLVPLMSAKGGKQTLGWSV
ncbi:hypothetical protein V6R86_11635 [Sphingomonas kaistensis]|uniref:Uncharacterized protein n=1 Tax=Sphingomonas kaistensis TaxID=298708 RepID=A0ABZ2G581_9SPHN